MGDRRRRLREPRHREPDVRHRLDSDGIHVLGPGSHWLCSGVYVRSREDKLWLTGSAEWAIANGTPAVSGVYRWQGWLFDAAAYEAVAVHRTVFLHQDWNTFNIELW